MRQRPLDAPQLMQDAKTARSSSGDVCRHRRISVQINAEVSNGADGRNIVGTDTEQYDKNLVHASIRRTRHQFSLCSIQLQAVASHPHRYVVDTGRQGILKTCWILCITEAVHVCHLCTDGLEGCARPPVEWGLRCIKETRSVRGPSLEVHHRWRLMTWSRNHLAERIEYDYWGSS